MCVCVWLNLSKKGALCENMKGLNFLRYPFISPYSRTWPHCIGNIFSLELSRGYEVQPNFRSHFIYPRESQVKVLKI